MKNSSGSLNLEVKPIPILIVGQPKSGTSALFEWLSQHQDVSPSIVKETRFFLDEDYPLSSILTKTQKHKDYLAFYNYTNEKYILEATPDYLYCQKPLELLNEFQKIKIIIIKRDPIERLISFFRYYQQQGIISTKLTFDEYIQWQMECKKDNNRPLYLRSLEHTKEHYIEKFKRVYGPNCIIVKYDNLRDRPEETLTTLLQSLGLSPMQDISKKIKQINKTRKSRNQNTTRIFRRVRQAILRNTINFQFARPILKLLSKLIQRFVYVDDAQNNILPNSKTVEIILNEVK